MEASAGAGDKSDADIDPAQKDQQEEESEKVKEEAADNDEVADEEQEKARDPQAKAAAGKAVLSTLASRMEDFWQAVSKGLHRMKLHELRTLLPGYNLGASLAVAESRVLP